MTRGRNAQLAVQLFHELRGAKGYDAANAWKAIAQLLLSCEVWASEWVPFHGVVVYREKNDFKLSHSEPNSVLRGAETLSAFLARELGCSRESLCASIATYWRQPTIKSLQPNNLVGHAFRSLVTESLACYGNAAITYDEEVDPRQLFPGGEFRTRSKKSKIDIVARRGGQVVALLSLKWRFRHDRVDIPDEAIAYMSAARRVNSQTRFYAVVGEFAASRLEKLLENSAPAHSNPAITATVHFNPELVRQGLGENGRIAHLKSLEWLIAETNKW